MLSSQLAPVPIYTAWWTEAHVCEQLAQSCYVERSGRDSCVFCVAVDVVAYHFVTYCEITKKWKQNVFICSSLSTVFTVTSIYENNSTCYIVNVLIKLTCCPSKTASLPPPKWLCYCVYFGLLVRPSVRPSVCLSVCMWAGLFTMSWIFFCKICWECSTNQSPI